MNDQSYVYIMSSSNKRALDTRVTSDLQKRVNEHKNHASPGSFSDRYNCVEFVYYEEFASLENAIAREKELKGWSRKKKDDLIASFNPALLDLDL